MIKKALETVALSVLISVLPIHADPLIQRHDMIALCGDSITAEHQYTAFIEDYLLMCQPIEDLDIAQLGWAGETSQGFLARLDSDLLPFKPTVATTCYGMNDGGYTPLTDTIANTYRQNQTALVEALKKNGVRTIVIGSPKCVDTFYYKLRNGADAATYNRTLSAFADIDRDIAAKEGIVYADVYAITTSAMQKSKAQYGDNYNAAGGDGVHPDYNGSFVIAYAFLKALGCDGNIGTLTVDTQSGQATGSPGHEIVSYQAGTLTVKSTRYPYCFGDNNGIEGMQKSISFNDDLNRYLLIVRGLTTPRAKITWGNTTKEYASADLQKGINLAAEFEHNPFSQQFSTVGGAVDAQENQEQFYVESFLNKLKRFKDIAPTAAAALDQTAAAGMAQHKLLLQKAAALVIPIQHTIKIEPTP
jgi:lysophospholipase L1-like esterase